MEDINQKFKDIFLKLLDTLFSVKFWVAVVTIGIGALTAFQAGADWLTILIGTLTALIGGGVYTISKTKQNIAFKETQLLSQRPVVNEKALISSKVCDCPNCTDNPQVLQPVTPFDVEGWEKRITDFAKNMYGNVTECTQFFASIDLLGNLPPDPNDYTTQIKFQISAQHGLKAWQELTGYDYYETADHLKDDPKCNYYSVKNMAMQTGKWPMLIKVERALWNAGFDLFNWSGLAIPSK
jgi:hypothetical protein